MNRFVPFVFIFASLMVLLSAAAIDGNCGINEFYTPPGKCAPCEVNCGEFVIPCQTADCRTGCQCFLGYERDMNGVCQNKNLCGTPPGTVD